MSSDEESNLSFNDLCFDSSQMKSELSSQRYTDDQLALIKQLKTLHNFSDETLNTIKLRIYDWDINETVKYYKNDKFCVDYFLDECKKNTQQHQQESEQLQQQCICPFNLAHKYHFYTIWNKLTPDGFKFVKLLLEYLLYTNKRPNSSNLYCCFGHVLRSLIKTREDALKCEKYFLKSISLNSKNCDAHSGYGILLTNKSGYLYNCNKALKHYELSCSVETDPNAPLFCVNYARMLSRQAKADEQYKTVLFYGEKAINYKQFAILDTAYFIASLASYVLKDYKKCVEYYEKEIEISNNFVRCDYFASYVAAKLYLLAQDKDVVVRDSDDDNQHPPTLAIEYGNKNNKHDNVSGLVQNGDDHKDKETNNWDQLYDDYVESYGYLFSLDDKNKNNYKDIKYLSYFNDMEVHNNNEILETNDDIDHVVNGYVRKNTKDIYDLSVLVKIIRQYFGPPGNESIFTVRHMHSRSESTGNMSQASLVLGHLYRTIIFNKSLFDMKTLKSQPIKFQIIQSHICDYWQNNSGLYQLGFGFTVGVIVIDKNEKVAFDYNTTTTNNNNNNNSNPLLLSTNMNLFVTDLPALYSKAVKFLAASHFVFDQDENNFVRKETFHLKFVNGDFDGLSKVVRRTTNKISHSGSRNGTIDIGQTVKIDVGCETTGDPIIYRQCNIIYPFLNKSAHVSQFGSESDDQDMIHFFPHVGGNSIIIEDEVSRCSNFCWLPVFSCSSCNCQSCSDSPLVLKLIK